jgi:hypothetical protein
MKFIELVYRNRCLEHGVLTPLLLDLMEEVVEVLEMV